LGRNSSGPERRQGDAPEHHGELAADLLREPIRPGGGTPTQRLLPDTEGLSEKNAGHSVHQAFGIGDFPGNRISSKGKDSRMGAALETTASAGLWKSHRGYWIAVPFAAAWILSVLSWLGICSGGCEETHLYRIFGLPLSPLGVGYFTLCGLAFLTRNRFRFSGFLVPVLLSGALGSEFVLVWYQKYVIGRWCPLCVGIALSVVTAC
jgi:hypothetical protein